MVKSRKRHNPVKGWAKSAPQSGKPRHQMYKKCGAKCFLMPNKKTPGESKFPICPKRSCKPSCKGVLSAYIRARQWRKKNPKYSKVAKKANRLYSKHRCNIDKSRRRKSRRRKSRRHKSRRHYRMTDEQKRDMFSDVDKVVSKKLTVPGKDPVAKARILKEFRDRWRKTHPKSRRKSSRKKSRRKSSRKKSRSSRKRHSSKMGCSKKRKAPCHKSNKCRWVRKLSACRRK